MTNIFTLSPAFRIHRAATIAGVASDLDSVIKSHLDDLNRLLGKGIITRGANKVGKDDIGTVIQKTLTPKRISSPNWDSGSLASVWSAEAADDKETLSELIDRTGDLSELKGAFHEYLGASLYSLDQNVRAVLRDYPAISDYLVARAYYGKYAQEINGLVNFILNNQAGAKNVADYAIVGAARTIIDRDQLKVPDYDKDDSGIVRQIRDAKLRMSAASFLPALHALVNNYIFNSYESKIISDAEAQIGKIPEDIKPQLIKYIKNSPVKIDKSNAAYFLPLFISQIKGAAEPAVPSEVDAEESARDFDVQTFEDDNLMIQISRSAVKCAAQLYYGMVLGDELDVFEVVNYFTHKYLVRGGIEIQDSGLRDDLQMYVFSHRFIDPKTNKIIDRMRPAERRMFYRQVFNYGAAAITEDLIVNSEFPRLWKVLILESAKYLERAQASPNPDNFVSRQNVMQAVEDLQYNLSTHCTGMANVITPLIYAELNFVVRRIMMHPEIIRQIVPAGGNWWRVVEALYMDMKKQRPRATVYYNKAKLGYDIIRAIADYSPAVFEDDKNFSEFISNVDAFITTQSILQESMMDEQRKDEITDETNYGLEPGTGSIPGAGSPSAAVKTNGDEWDF